MITGYYLINVLLGVISINFIRNKRFILNNIFFSSHIFFFFSLVVIGSFYVYFPSYSPYNNIDYYSDDFFIVLTLYQIILLIFCFFLSSYNNKSKNQIINLYKIRLRKIYYYFPLFLSFVIVLHSLIVDGIPIFYRIIFTEISNDAIVLERNLFFEEEESFFIKELGFYICPIFMCIYTFIKKEISKNIFNKTIFILNLIYASFLSLSFLHKTPLLILFLSIFICYYLINNQSFSFKKVLLVFISLFLLIIVQYYIVLKNQDIISLWTVFNGILNRIFGVYPLGLALAIDITSETGYLMGNTIPNFLGLFPNSINLSKIIHYELFGYDGYAPSPSLGYAYANFGIFGVLFFSIFSSLFLIILNQSVRKINNIYIVILIYCIFIPQVMFFSMSSIFDSILNPRDYVIYGSIILIMLLRIRNK